MQKSASGLFFSSDSRSESFKSVKAQKCSFQKYEKLASGFLKELAQKTQKEACKELFPSNRWQKVICKWITAARATDNGV